MIHPKKAQVTLFIALGLVIFILVSVSIYFMTSTKQVAETQTIRRTPTSFQDYIEICLEDTARQAVRNIGSRGGYLEIPYFIRNDRNAFIALDPKAVFGIPAWYYKGEFRIPTVSEMETEISGYVQENIGNCFESYDAYEKSYNVTERSGKEVTTSISKSTVFINLDYAVDVVAEKASQTGSYDAFTVTLPVKLGQMHELAKRITHSERLNANFENELIDLMSGHPDVPITQMDLSCFPEEWDVSAVRDTIKNLVYYNLQRVRFKGTRHASFEQDVSDYERYGGFNLMDMREGRLPDNVPDDSYEFFNLFFDIEPPTSYRGEDYDFSSLRTAVKYYPDQNFNFIVRPSSGGRMRSSMAQFPGTDIPFCVQMSHFTYDVGFLIEIDIYDESAFGDEGFLFRFALPVNIKSNAAEKEDYLFNTLEAPAQFDDPCEDLEGEYRIKATGIEAGIDNMELKDVDLSYDCRAFGCYLGKTKAERGAYQLITGLPSTCSGGLINAEKDGYLPARIQHRGDAEDITIEMRKIRNFNTSIIIRPSSDLGQRRVLDNDEAVIVRMAPDDHDHEVNMIFDSETQTNLAELVVDEGDYRIEAYLYDEDSNNIYGGYIGNFTYSFADTGSRDRLELPIVRYAPTPLPFNDMAQLQVIQYIRDGSYVEALPPRFS